MIPRSCRTQVATAALAMNPYASNIHAAEQASQLLHQKVMRPAYDFCQRVGGALYSWRVVVAWMAFPSKHLLCCPRWILLLDR